MAIHNDEVILMAKRTQSNRSVSKDKPNIERQIYQALRAAGLVFPETEDEVKRAEAVMANEEITVPAEMADPMKVFECYQTRSAERFFTVPEGIDESAGAIVFADDVEGFNSILSEGKNSGLSNVQLAHKARLSIALLTKLDLRLVRYKTIPGKVIENVASAIRRTVEEVSAYLQGRSRFALDASYKADEAPEIPEQQDFFEAVRTDSSLTNDDRENLLSLKSR
jgi:hypothetical protein